MMTQHIPVLKFSGRVSKYNLNLDSLLCFSFMLHKSSIVSSEIPSIFSKIGNYLQHKIIYKSCYKSKALLASMPRTKFCYSNKITISDSFKNSPDMMTDTGISRAVSPAFRSTLATAPLPASSTPK